MEKKYMNVWIKDNGNGFQYGGVYTYDRKHNGVKEFYLVDNRWCQKYDFGKNFYNYSLEFYSNECLCLNDYENNLLFKAYFNTLDEVKQCMLTYGIEMKIVERF